MPATARDIVLPKLRSFPLFSELGPEELETMATMVTLTSYDRGAVICERESHGEAMYLLISGRVKVSLIASDGREIALSYLDAPSHFGEMALVDSEPRSADVVAVSDCEVIALDAKDLASAIRVQPKLALSLIATLSRRLRQTIARLEEMAFCDAKHRVMRVIFNVASASSEGSNSSLVKGLTQYEIGTLAGTSRETASRIISQLQKDGVLETHGRSMTVDLAAMREAMGHQ